MAWYAVVVASLVPIAELDPVTHVGSLSEKLTNPAAVTVMPDGTVLVTDLAHNHIARFDGAGASIGAWLIPEGPIDVAVHPATGDFYISLRDERAVGVYTHETGTDTLVRIGALGEGNPMVTFTKPTDIDIAADTGRIYVADAGGDTVYGFESDGSLALMFGAEGEALGEFRSPTAIAIDEANSRIIVADRDNFRVQVFTLSGVFQYRFGYRIRYLPGGFEEGWMPRTQGLAADTDGHIYVVDALMSTVRVFDPSGAELGKVLEYGAGPGGLRAPFGAAVNPDESRLYVVNAGTSSVEVFELPGFTLAAQGDQTQRETKHGTLNPPGTNLCEHDPARADVKASIDADDGTISSLKPQARSARRVRSQRETGDGYAASTALSNYDGPHIIEASFICGRCHGVTGQPGGHVDTLEGQSVLCMSCHAGSGDALGLAVVSGDMADPYGTNPWSADGLGRSHAWGVSAISDAADSVGPLPDSELDRYLDADGKIKCATCHEQHNSDTGSPYLRMANERDQMCKQCHAPRVKAPGEGGSHPSGFDYPGHVGEFPLDDDVSPLTLKYGNIECMTCHGTHEADSGGAHEGSGDGMLLRTANDKTLCQLCHTEHAIHEVTGSWDPTCIECHTMHDSDNVNFSLVSTSVYNVTLGVDKPVVLTSRTGPFGFGDAGPADDGICQVCHTATAYHTHDGSGAGHYNGLDCTDCHSHDSGFMPSDCDACHGQPPDGQPPIGDVFPNQAGSHAAHMTDANGPGITDCSLCHADIGAGVHINDLVSFASGVDADTNGNIDLDETDVCDSCHSPDGPFDGVAEAKGNWTTGTSVSCEGCHDEGTSTIQGVSAPAVAGDNATSGYFVSGHGRNGVVACSDCHDATAAHFDGLARTYGFDSAYYGPSQSGVAYASAYRLRYVDGEVPLMIPGNYNITFGYDAGLMRDTAFRLCFACHDSAKVFDDTPGDGIDSNFKAAPPNPPRNYSYAWGSGAVTNEHVAHILNYVGPFADSDWDTATIGPGGSNGCDSLATCTICHNVHGAAGTAGSTNEAMLRDGSHVGRAGFGFSYVVEDTASGGYPWVTSVDATEATSVGAILRLNSNDMCAGSGCHDDPSPPPADAYDATGSAWGTYLEYYRPWSDYVGGGAATAATAATPAVEHLKLRRSPGR